MMSFPIWCFCGRSFRLCNPKTHIFCFVVFRESYPPLDLLYHNFPSVRVPLIVLYTIPTATTTTSKRLCISRLRIHIYSLTLY